MGLRKSAPDAMAPPPPNPGGGAVTALADPPAGLDEVPDIAEAGPAAAECESTGAALVAAGVLETDRFAEASTEAAGDLLTLGQLLLSRYGVTRGNLAQAVATACSVDVADSSIGELDEEIVARFPEDVARQHKAIPVADQDGTLVLYAADPSPARRSQVESATGSTFVWKASDDKTVTSFIEQMYRSSADVGGLVEATLAVELLELSSVLLADEGVNTLGEAASRKVKEDSLLLRDPTFSKTFPELP